MPGKTVVVTDSTASLPPEVSHERGIVVVPLQVVIGATVYDEGPGGATPEMVAEVERLTDDVAGRFAMPTDFVLPGASRVSAALELARTVVRRAEREALSVAVEGSSVLPYLNRLSSLAWALARWQEEDHPLAKDR